jgi:magnesium transporter
MWPVGHGDTETTPVTSFSPSQAVTVRYDEPRPFTLISNKLREGMPATVGGESIMMDFA